MSKINSRSKGKRGEYQVRDMFIAHGFAARRGQQFQGGPDSPDVVIPDLDAFLHVESKLVENLDLNKAVEQAQRDGVEKLPVVFHKKSHKAWLVTMDVESFFELIIKLHDNEQRENFNSNHSDVAESSPDVSQSKNPSG